MTAIHFIGDFWWLWIVIAITAFTLGVIQEKITAVPNQHGIVTWLALKSSLVAVLALYGGIGMFILALFIRVVRYFF